MKIIDVICSKGKTGYFFDDQRAIKNNAEKCGEYYKGTPMTPGFSAIRQSGESISVMLMLEDGQIAHGDCAAVQYSGAGGRDRLFLADEYIDVINESVAPVLIGQELDSFRELSDKVENIRSENGAKLHTAIRYGVTQALLDGVAKAKKKLMAEIISDEYHTDLATEAVPIFSQSGDERYNNVDKMIIKEVDVLPHALINNVKTKLGDKGELLLKYVKWLKERIIELRSREDYQPVLHIDVYGTIGIAFDNDYDKMVEYLRSLEEAAHPFKLRIEGPIDVEERQGEMLALKKLREQMDKENVAVEIVADEWCNTLEDIKYFADNKAGHMVQIKTPDLGGINNTIEAVLYCKEKGIGAYLGGTCNETDGSARVACHIAVATKPDQILAKPGMGVDEGLMIVNNEIQRIIAVTNKRVNK